MPKRNLLIIKIAEPKSMDDHDQAMIPIGSRREIYKSLEDYNTFPDREGGEFLYGPGLTIQIPANDGEVTQMLVSLADEETAWPVLDRIRNAMGWNLMDPDSGRVL